MFFTQMRYVARLRVRLVTLFISLVLFGVAGSFAEEPATVDRNTESGILDLLGGTDRTTQFRALKLRRAEVMRDMSATDARIQELKQNIRLADEKLSSLQIELENLKARRLVGDVLTFENNLAKKQRQLERLSEEFAAYAQEQQRKHEILRNDGSLSSEDIESAAAAMKSTTLRVKADFDSQIKDAQVDIDAARRELEAEKLRIAEAAAEEQEKITRINGDISSNSQSVKSMYDEIAEKLALLNTLTDSIDRVDSDISELIKQSDAESSFKIAVSLTFAGLVSFVILGFYIIAGRNRDVVYTIFSNDSGIQFITLFSIVIAVILFGIIGVLEGKELAALLGGLSGYILGRGSVGQKSSDRPDEAPQPAPPT